MIKIIIRYLAVLIALAAFVVWQIGPPLHWFPEAPKGQEELVNLLKLVLTMLSALVLYEVSRALDKMEEEKANQRTSDALRRIEDALHRKVDVVKSPSASTEYANVWSGFTDKYWAYNPSYRGIENRPGMDTEKLVTDVFVPRYRDPKLTGAFYLFLTKDEDGKKDLDEFRILMMKVREQCPEISKKLQVRELKGEDATQDAEVYRGTKQGVMTSIVELREPGLTGGRGSPYYYLVVTDVEINGRLREHFEKAWARADKIDIFSSPISAAR